MTEKKKVRVYCYHCGVRYIIGDPGDSFTCGEHYMFGGVLRIEETPVGPPSEGQLEALRAYLESQHEFNEWMVGLRRDGKAPMPEQFTGLRRLSESADRFRETGAWPYLAILATLEVEVGNAITRGWPSQPEFRFVTPRQPWLWPVEGEEG